MIRAFIDGLAIERAAVHAWEDRRTAAVRKKLGLATSNAPRDVQREQLVDRKLEIGHDGLRALIGRELSWSGTYTRLSSALAPARRRFSVCHLDVSEGSAEYFMRWFEGRVGEGDERAIIAACPDHYIATINSSGRPIIVETAGGSPLPMEFHLDTSDETAVLTERDAAYPLQMAGTAKQSDGRVVGGLRHQFTQVGDGFRASLTVELPFPTPSRIVKQHQWHIAVEFSNWIEAAAASRLTAK